MVIMMLRPFVSFLHDGKLIDMRFQVDRVTWRNGKMGVCLNMCLINLEWR